MSEKLINICPLSAGLSKSFLCWSEEQQQCVVRYPHSGACKSIPTEEAAEELRKHGLKYFIPKLEKLSGKNLSETMPCTKSAAAERGQGE